MRMNIWNIFEMRVKNIVYERPSQLCSHLKKLWKESPKKIHNITAMVFHISYQFHIFIPINSSSTGLLRPAPSCCLAGMEEIFQLGITNLPARTLTIYNLLTLKWKPQNVYHLFGRNKLVRHLLLSTKLMLSWQPNLECSCFLRKITFVCLDHFRIILLVLISLESYLVVFWCSGKIKKPNMAVQK